MKLNSTFYKTIIPLLVLFLNHEAVAQNGTLKEKQPVTDGYDYITYLPEGYDGIKNFPILFYLHGGQGILDGEKGFGDDPDPKKGLAQFRFGPPNLINNLVNVKNYPSYTLWPTDKFIVVIPHLPKDAINYPDPNDQLWDVTKVAKVVNDALDRYTVDPQKIYMSGISLGAKGVWDYIMLDEDEFFNENGINLTKPIAAIPISGNADPSNICNAKDVYVWGLHGSDDRNVEALGQSTNPNQSERYGTTTLVQEYNNCGSQIKARLDTLTGVGHKGWNEYYDLTAGYDLYNWLLDHNTNKIPDLKPYVNAGMNEIKILLSNSNKLTLYGYGYDSESIYDISFGWDLTDGVDANVLFLTPKTEKNVIVKFVHAGDYEFSLKVRDKSNTRSDRILVRVLDNPSENKVISQLEVKEVGDVDYRILKNGDRIDNPSNGIVDLRAVDESGAGSIRFSLGENTNYNTLWKKADHFYPFALDGAKWRPTTGEYIISVTPFVGQKPAVNPGITSQYAIYVNEDPPIVLPVEFLDFSAKKMGEKIQLDWSTASEKGNDFFTIERSPTAADHFEAIGTVAGAGDSNAHKNYSFTDYAPLGGGAYYRIKQTDFNGDSDYSKIVKVSGSSLFEASLFPNPSERGLANLRLYSQDPYSKVTVHVIDAIGNVYLTESIAAEKLLHEEGYQLRATNTLSAGLYFVIIDQGKNSIQKKLVIK